jgi:hypothetical protein
MHHRAQSFLYTAYTPRALLIKIFCFRRVSCDGYRVNFRTHQLFICKTSRSIFFLWRTKDCVASLVVYHRLFAVSRVVATSKKAQFPYRRYTSCRARPVAQESAFRERSLTLPKSGWGRKRKKPDKLKSQFVSIYSREIASKSTIIHVISGAEHESRR